MIKNYIKKNKALMPEGDGPLIDKKGIKIFDSIIVFSEYCAKSAQDNSYNEEAPFSGKYKIYNDSYSYFLLKCKEASIKAAFVTSKDIIGPGLFQSSWTYDEEWVRNDCKAYSELIFDRFGRINPEQKNKLKLLISSKSIYIFNKKTQELFGNKLNTYKYFKEFVIPTVEIKDISKKNLYLAKAKLDKLLKKHKNKEDFNDNYIIKRKCGASGIGIFKVNFNNLKKSLKEIEEYHKSMKNRKSVSYILQPFINYDKGFVFGKYKEFIDLRVILIKHKIVQTYIRVAKKGDFRCNEHQGGNLVYISKKIIPKDVLAMIQKITKKLNLKHRLYALDFIKSNNGNLYFIEGNSKLGIDWNHKKKVNETKTKELINLIVNELKSSVKENSKSY